MLRWKSVPWIKKSGVMTGQLQERDNHSKQLEATISRFEQELAEANKPLHREEGEQKRVTDEAKAKIF